MFSAIDFIAVACGLSRSCAKREFKDLAGLEGLARLARFDGTGQSQAQSQAQRDTPVLTGIGLQRLLAALGDKVLAGRFKGIEGRLKRLMGGDSSAIKIWRADGGARTDAEKMEDNRMDPGGKKRRPEVEELELEERRNRANTQALSNTQTMLEILARLRPGVPLDDGTIERVAEQTKAILLGNAQPRTLQPRTLQPGTLQPGTLQPRTLQPRPPSEASSVTSLSDAELTESEDDVGIRVSTVAKDINVPCTEGQLKEIGKKMAAKYKEVYASPPPKLTRRVGSQIVKINSYTEKDRAMMEAVIRGYMQA